MAWHAVPEKDIQVPPPRQKLKVRHAPTVESMHDVASAWPASSAVEELSDREHYQSAADVAATAGAAAAAAALQVIHAAGEQVQARLQVKHMADLAGLVLCKQPCVELETLPGCAERLLSQNHCNQLWR